MKKNLLILSIISLIFFTSCQSTKTVSSEPEKISDSEETVSILNSEQNQNQTEEASESQAAVSSNQVLPAKTEKDSITLLFTGDIMAHSVNYQISTYEKIWRDIAPVIQKSDLAFGNIEAPIDSTKKASSYPNFNMTRKYVEAFIDAGFDVFSLCNNHTNDQGLSGIKETRNSVKYFTERSLEKNESIYFSGLKEKEGEYTHNLIEKDGWKILFLPVTEILNRPDYSDYINYVKPDSEHRKIFISYVKKLREENPCDLFVLSVHANEPEYTRKVTSEQNQFYMDLLDAGVDVVWANHAHIIKDRKYIFYSKTHSQKVIMYANGNVISGQRTAPDLTSKNPVGERDNTGDGLMAEITFRKQENNPPEIISVENHFITTYINTAGEYVIKPLNKEFIDYLYDVPRNSWAKYITKRIEINNEYTKDLILWQ